MKINKIQKISLTKHLAIMIKSGISLSEALTNLSLSSKTVATRQIISQVNLMVENGSTLSDSLAKHPDIFDDYYLGIVRVGESTGHLDTSLLYLAEQLQQEYALEKKVSGALMYPGIVLVATTLLGAAISMFILPKLTDFFSAFDSKLPATTIVLLRLSLFMKNYGVIFFISLFSFFAVLALILRLPKIRPHWHLLLLRLPLIGGLIQERELSRLSRNLGLLIKSGLPLSQALEITAKSQTNLAYRLAITSLHQNLEKGKNIADMIRQSSTFLFPRLVSDMVAVGEKTGTLDESLIYLGEFYEESIEETAKNLTTILEPAILIFIGLIVAFVALAVISPIYQLTGSLG